MKITAKVFKRESAGAPSIKAYANITLDDIIVIRDIKIVDGKNGLFIAFPNRKMPNGEYKDIVFPITKEAREQIIKIILDEYGRVNMTQNNLDSANLPF